jgi:hypothetical protein
MRDAYKTLVGKLEGKRPFEIGKRRWEDNIKMDLRDLVLEGVDWVHLAQDIGPVVGSCEHDNEPSGSIKRGNFLTS